MPPDNETQRHYATLRDRVAKLERELGELAKRLDETDASLTDHIDSFDSHVGELTRRVGRLELEADIEHGRDLAELDQRVSNLERSIDTR